MRLKKLTKVLFIRQIEGESMLPKYKPGQFVISSSIVSPKVGRVVIVEHEGKQKIKIVDDVSDGKIRVLGLNPARSVDSRHFGFLPIKSVIGVVIAKLG